MTGAPFLSTPLPRPADAQIVDWYLTLNHWGWPRDFWKPERPPWAEPRCWEHALHLGAYCAISKIVDDEAALTEHRRRLALRPVTPQTPPPLTPWGRLVQALRIGQSYYAMMRAPDHHTGRLWALITSVRMASSVLRWWLWPAPIPPRPVDRLAACQADLHAANRALARVKTSLDHYIGQAIRARRERDDAEQERDRAQGIVVRALAERDEAVKYGLYLDGEIDGFHRREQALTALADGLRAELRELRAGVAVGALRKKGRR